MTLLVFLWVHLAWAWAPEGVLMLHEQQWDVADQEYYHVHSV